jgi:hypothetical protein
VFRGALRHATPTSKVSGTTTRIPVAAASVSASASASAVAVKSAGSTTASGAVLATPSTVLPASAGPSHRTPGGPGSAAVTASRDYNSRGDVSLELESGRGQALIGVRSSHEHRESVQQQQQQQQQPHARYPARPVQAAASEQEENSSIAVPRSSAPPLPSPHPKYHASPASSPASFPVPALVPDTAPVYPQGHGAHPSQAQARATASFLDSAAAVGDTVRMESENHSFASSTAGASAGADASFSVGIANPAEIILAQQVQLDALRRQVEVLRRLVVGLGGKLPTSALFTSNSESFALATAPGIGGASAGAGGKDVPKNAASASPALASAGASEKGSFSNESSAQRNHTRGITGLSDIVVSSEQSFEYSNLDYQPSYQTKESVAGSNTRHSPESAASLQDSLQQPQHASAGILILLLSNVTVLFLVGYVVLIHFRWRL